MSILGLAVERIWSNPKERRAFETETGLTDSTTEVYQRRFSTWAKAKVRGCK